MADPQGERERIAAQLARMRVQLSEQSLLVRRDLDVGRRMSESLRKDSWGWMSVAAIFGWLLSRLPARKKKIYVQTANPEKLGSRPSQGFMGQVWRGLWSIAKPLLVAYVTKKIAEKAKIPGRKWL
jgi:hypothetical protein